MISEDHSIDRDNLKKKIKIVFYFFFIFVRKCKLCSVLEFVFHKNYFNLTEIYFEAIKNGGK